jgi:hypothetical protein
VTTPPRLQLADELLRRFAATLRSAQLYSKGHPIIARNLESLATALQLLHSLQPSVVVGLVADEVIVDDMPMAKADTMGPLVRRLQTAGVERITIDRGVTTEESAQGYRKVMTGNARALQRWLDQGNNMMKLDQMIGPEARQNLKDITLLLSNVKDSRATNEAVGAIRAEISKKLGRGGTGSYRTISRPVNGCVRLTTFHPTRAAARFLPVSGPP